MLVGIKGVRRMTDAEKLLSLMAHLKEEKNSDEQAAMDEMARITMMTYNAYIKAGCSNSLARHFTTEVIKASIIANGGKK